MVTPMVTPWNGGQQDEDHSGGSGRALNGIQRLAAFSWTGAMRSAMKTWRIVSVYPPISNSAHQRAMRTGLIIHIDFDL